MQLAAIDKARKTREKESKIILGVGVGVGVGVGAKSFSSHIFAIHNKRNNNNAT